MTNIQKPYYSKFVTRDACLITFQAWIKSDTDKIEEWIGLKTDRIICESNRGVISAYEQPLFTELVAKKLNILTKRTGWLEEKIKIHQTLTEKIKHLIIELKQKVSHNTLIKLFEHLVAWHGGMGIVYSVPNVVGMSASIVKRSMEHRKLTEHILYDSDRIFESCAKFLFKDYADYVKCLTIDEIKNKHIPAVDILKERMKYYIYYDSKVILKKTLNQVANELLIEIESVESPKNTSEFEGVVANKGQVKGTVKLVFKKNNLGKVKHGDILVTSMTTPEFLQAMKKAAAFITDEGGITCHAAIVARELKKPCIIGTKIATQVLKDGDQVEVDADRGIVTILKKVDG